MKNSPFYKQAELMLRCLASLKEQKEFALKGGTALNFFVFDLPRLSVDIDLVFLPDYSRDEALQAISDGLSSLGNRIEKDVPGSKIQNTSSLGSTLISKINVLSQGLAVTIEPNLVIRTTLKAPKMRSIVKRAQDLFETEQEVLVLDQNEILAGSKNRKSSKERPFIAHSTFQGLQLENSKRVSDTLLECIRTGELTTFRDVLASFIMSTNKLHLAKKAGLGRQTLYDLMDPKKNFNPGLSTISAIIRGLA